MSTSESKVEIKLISESDIPLAVATIRQAFQGDPFADFIYDRLKFSNSRNLASLGLRIRYGIRTGRIYVAHTPERRCAGVAMWMPCRPLAQKQTWGEWWEEWMLWFGQVRMNLWYGRGGLNVKRYLLWKERQAELQSKLWTDPRGYWFLNMLTIHPSCQGQGIGKKLVEIVHKQADAEGARCYLESSKFEPNVAIYKKMGYEYAGDIECKEGDGYCKLFAMIREPQSNTENAPLPN